MAWQRNIFGVAVRRKVKCQASPKVCREGNPPEIEDQACEAARRAYDIEKGQPTGSAATGLPGFGSLFTRSPTVQGGK